MKNSSTCTTISLNTVFLFCFFSKAITLAKVSHPQRFGYSTLAITCHLCRFISSAELDRKRTLIFLYISGEHGSYNEKWFSLEQFFPLVSAPVLTISWQIHNSSLSQRLLGRSVRLSQKNTSKMSWKFCGLRPQSQGWPLPVSGRSAIEGHSIQCLSGPERRGEGVHVASYMLVLHRSDQGDAVCA